MSFQQLDADKKMQQKKIRMLQKFVDNGECEILESESCFLQQGPGIDSGNLDLKIIAEDHNHTHLGIRNYSTSTLTLSNIRYCGFNGNSKDNDTTESNTDTEGMSTAQKAFMSCTPPFKKRREENNVLCNQSHASSETPVQKKHIHDIIQEWGVLMANIPRYDFGDVIPNNMGSGRNGAKKAGKNGTTGILALSMSNYFMMTEYEDDSIILGNRAGLKKFEFLLNYFIALAYEGMHFENTFPILWEDQGMKNKAPKIYEKIVKQTDSGRHIQADIQIALSSYLSSENLRGEEKDDKNLITSPNTINTKNQKSSAGGEQSSGSCQTTNSTKNNQASTSKTSGSNVASYKDRSKGNAPSSQDYQGNTLTAATQLSKAEKVQLLNNLKTQLTNADSVISAAKDDIKTLARGYYDVGVYNLPSDPQGVFQTPLELLSIKERDALAQGLKGRAVRREFFAAYKTSADKGHMEYIREKSPNGPSLFGFEYSAGGNGNKSVVKRPSASKQNTSQTVPDSSHIAAFYDVLKTAGFPLLLSSQQSTKSANRNNNKSQTLNRYDYQSACREISLYLSYRCSILDVSVIIGDELTQNAKSSQTNDAKKSTPNTNNNSKGDPTVEAYSTLLQGYVSISAEQVDTPLTAVNRLFPARDFIIINDSSGEKGSETDTKPNESKNNKKGNAVSNGSVTCPPATILGNSAGQLPPWKIIYENKDITTLNILKKVYQDAAAALTALVKELKAQCLFSAVHIATCPRSAQERQDYNNRYITGVDISEFHKLAYIPPGILHTVQAAQIFSGIPSLIAATSFHGSGLNSKQPHVAPISKKKHKMIMNMMTTGKGCHYPLLVAEDYMNLYIENNQVNQGDAVSASHTEDDNNEEHYKSAINNNSIISDSHQSTEDYAKIQEEERIAKKKVSGSVGATIQSATAVVLRQDTSTTTFGTAAFFCSMLGLNGSAAASLLKQRHLLRPGAKDILFNKKKKNKLNQPLTEQKIEEKNQNSTEGYLCINSEERCDDNIEEDTETENGEEDHIPKSSSSSVLSYSDGDVGEHYSNYAEEDEKCENELIEKEKKNKIENKNYDAYDVITTPKQENALETHVNTKATPEKHSGIDSIPSPKSNTKVKPRSKAPRANISISGLARRSRESLDREMTLVEEHFSGFHDYVQKYYRNVAEKAFKHPKARLPEFLASLQKSDTRTDNYITSDKSSGQGMKYSCQHILHLPVDLLKKDEKNKVHHLGDEDRFKYLSKCQPLYKYHFRHQLDVFHMMKIPKRDRTTDMNKTAVIERIKQVVGIWETAADYFDLTFDLPWDYTDIPDVMPRKKDRIDSTSKVFLDARNIDGCLHNSLSTSSILSPTAAGEVSITQVPVLKPVAAESISTRIASIDSHEFQCDPPACESNVADAMKGPLQSVLNGIPQMKKFKIEEYDIKAESLKHLSTAALNELMYAAEKEFSQFHDSVEKYYRDVADKAKAHPSAILPWFLKDCMNDVHLNNILHLPVELLTREEKERVHGKVNEDNRFLYLTKVQHIYRERFGDQLQVFSEMKLKPRLKPGTVGERELYITRLAEVRDICIRSRDLFLANYQKPWDYSDMPSTWKDDMYPDYYVGSAARGDMDCSPLRESPLSSCGFGQSNGLINNPLLVYAEPKPPILPKNVIEIVKVAAQHPAAYIGPLVQRLENTFRTRREAVQKEQRQRLDERFLKLSFQERKKKLPSYLVTLFDVNRYGTRDILHLPIDLLTEKEKEIAHKLPDEDRSLYLTRGQMEYSDRYHDFIVLLRKAKIPSRSLPVSDMTKDQLLLRVRDVLKAIGVCDHVTCDVSSFNGTTTSSINKRGGSYSYNSAPVCPNYDVVDETLNSITSSLTEKEFDYYTSEIRRHLNDLQQSKQTLRSIKRERFDAAMGQNLAIKKKKCVMLLEGIVTAPIEKDHPMCMMLCVPVYLRKKEENAALENCFDADIHVEVLKRAKFFFERDLSAFVAAEGAVAGIPVDGTVASEFGLITKEDLVDRCELVNRAKNDFKKVLKPLLKSVGKPESHFTVLYTSNDLQDALNRYMGIMHHSSFSPGTHHTPVSPSVVGTPVTGLEKRTAIPPSPNIGKAPVKPQSGVSQVNSRAPTKSSSAPDITTHHNTLLKQYHTPTVHTISSVDNLRLTPVSDDKPTIKLSDKAIATISIAKEHAESPSAPYSPCAKSTRDIDVIRSLCIKSKNSKMLRDACGANRKLYLKDYNRFIRSSRKLFDGELALQVVPFESIGCVDPRTANDLDYISRDTRIPNSLKKLLDYPEVFLTDEERASVYELIRESEMSNNNTPLCTEFYSKLQKSVYRECRIRSEYIKALEPCEEAAVVAEKATNFIGGRVSDQIQATVNAITAMRQQQEAFESLETLLKLRIPVAIEQFKMTYGNEALGTLCDYSDDKDDDLESQFSSGSSVFDPSKDARHFPQNQTKKLSEGIGLGISSRSEEIIPENNYFEQNASCSEKGIGSSEEDYFRNDQDNGDAESANTDDGWFDPEAILADIAEKDPMNNMDDSYEPHYNINDLRAGGMGHHTDIIPHNGAIGMNGGMRNECTLSNFESSLFRNYSSVNERSHRSDTSSVVFPMTQFSSPLHVQALSGDLDNVSDVIIADTGNKDIGGDNRHFSGAKTSTRGRILTPSPSSNSNRTKGYRDMNIAHTQRKDPVKHVFLGTTKNHKHLGGQTDHTAGSFNPNKYKPYTDSSATGQVLYWTAPSEVNTSNIHGAHKRHHGAINEYNSLGGISGNTGAMDLVSHVRHHTMSGQDSHYTTIPHGSPLGPPKAMGE